MVTTTKRPLVDNRLKFSEKAHAYRVGRKKLISVTQFVKSFFPKFDEKKFAKLVANARTRKGVKTTMREVLKEWKAIASEGTAVHKEIELYINGQENRCDMLPFYDGRLKSQQGFRAVNELYKEYGEGIFYPELRIYSESLGIAGTIDLLILTKEGTAVIVDWKTNKTLRGKVPDIEHTFADLIDGNLTHYSLQLGLYALILEDEYNIKIQNLMLVHIDENGYKQIPVPFLRAIVESMISQRKDENT